MAGSSRRVKRMQRHHNKHKGGLNLVSLMDIFTILVFFLLVNSSSTPELPGKKDLSLPKSTATAAPKDDYFLAITPAGILLQGKPVISLKALGYDTSDLEKALASAPQGAAAKQKSSALIAPAQSRGRVIIPELRDALKQTVADAQIQQAGPYSLTVVADENLPYDLMRRIILSCQAADFLDIRFAATQVAQAQSGDASSGGSGPAAP